MRHLRHGMWLHLHERRSCVIVALEGVRHAGGQCLLGACHLVNGLEQLRLILLEILVLLLPNGDRFVQCRFVLGDLFRRRRNLRAKLLDQWFQILDLSLQLSELLLSSSNRLFLSLFVCLAPAVELCLQVFIGLLVLFELLLHALQECDDLLDRLQSVFRRQAKSQSGSSRNCKYSCEQEHGCLTSHGFNGAGRHTLLFAGAGDPTRGENSQCP
mmetsp:Transcript_102474/g.182037  ORF Transcript_102474/g.182037 Transcript_102474/m.182037 type:complete len:214 (+) Transcript_102474:1676-2317(+)